KLRLYALTVHSSCSTEAPRSSRIVLSAVDTTSVSRAAISDPTAVNATIQAVAALVLIRSTSASFARAFANRDPVPARNPSPARYIRREVEPAATAVGIERVAAMLAARREELAEPHARAAGDRRRPRLHPPARSP